MNQRQKKVQSNNNLLASCWRTEPKSCKYYNHKCLCVYYIDVACDTPTQRTI